MTLKDFFRKNPTITKRDMANALDTDTATVFSWVRGREPKLSTALAIEAFTNGQVKVFDLVGVNKKEVKKRK
jgi:hypothetical protein